MMKQISSYWGSLSIRDKRALTLLLLATSIWLVFRLASSLVDTREAAERRVQQLHVQLHEMQQLLPVLKSRGSNGRVTGNLATLINGIGRQTDVEYSSIRPSNTGVQLVITEISEEKFGAWLNALKVHDLTVIAMSLSIDQKGLLAVNMQLSNQ